MVANEPKTMMMRLLTGGGGGEGGEGGAGKSQSWRRASVVA
eukprot:COSAG06_NODE_70999_length_188_cov_61.202247_1_plen_40_part_10